MINKYYRGFQRVTFPQPDEEDTTKKNDSILELAEDVENAACQLWDMTAEPDVVHYLLSLSVVDILHLAKDVITLSRAPRLTVSIQCVSFQVTILFDRC